MSDLIIYRGQIEKNLSDIKIAANAKENEINTEIGSQPLNNFTINDIENENILSDNLLCSNSSDIVGYIGVETLRDVNFIANISSPLSLENPGTIQGLFVKIDTMFRGTIRVSELFYNTSTTTETFTIDLSPLKSELFTNDDQASGTVAMRGSTVQVQGNVRAVSGTNNILITLFANLAIQGVLVINFSFI